MLKTLITKPSLATCLSNKTSLFLHFLSGPVEAEPPTLHLLARPSHLAPVHPVPYRILLGKQPNVHSKPEELHNDIISYNSNIKSITLFSSEVLSTYPLRLNVCIWRMCSRDCSSMIESHPQWSCSRPRVHGNEQADSFPARYRIDIPNDACEVG